MNTVTITARPQSYEFTGTIPCQEINGLLDQHWENMKPHLNPEIVRKVRQGFRDTTPIDQMRNRIIAMSGGFSKFYESVFLSAIVEQARAQGYEILLWVRLGVEKNTEQYDFVAIGYLVPSVVVTGPLPRYFRYRHHELPDDDVKAAENVIRIENDLTNHLGSMLAQKIQISALPSEWHDATVTRHYESTLASYGGNPELTNRSYGAKDKMSAMMTIDTIMTRSFILTLMLRQWGIEHKIEGDTSFSNLTKYAEHVHRLIIKETTYSIVDRDVPESIEGIETPGDQNESTSA